MLTDLVLALVLGFMGCFAAFFPHLVTPFKFRSFVDFRDDVVITLMIQFVGVLMLLLATQHFYPLMYRYL